MPVAVAVFNRYDRLVGPRLGWFISFGRFTWFDTTPTRGRGAPLCLPLLVGLSPSRGGFEALTAGLPGFPARLRFRPLPPRTRPPRSLGLPGSLKLPGLPGLLGSLRLTGLTGPPAPGRAGRGCGVGGVGGVGGGG